MIPFFPFIRPPYPLVNLKVPVEMVDEGEGSRPPAGNKGNSASASLF